jgi:hypothetical protein
VLFDPDNDMMAVFFGHARGGTLLYMQPDGSDSGAVRLMSSADLDDAGAKFSSAATMRTL